MDRPTRLAASQSSHSLNSKAAIPRPRRLPASASSISLGFPHSTSFRSLIGVEARARSSGTWTASSGELGLKSDVEYAPDRVLFIHEYNQLAKKYGVRQLILEDFDSQQRVAPSANKSGGWLQRILRFNTKSCTSPCRHTPDQDSHGVHKRSASSLIHFNSSRKDHCKCIDLHEMVRLSGKSIFHLPHEYAPGSLVLPTCIRATAQNLAQNATARGIFRVPGSLKVVTALFEHYCCPGNGSEDISGTICSATLPHYIQYSVHDVASTFKRLLSSIPGGILGSLAIFDAFIAIHSHLNGEPEFPRTKHTKVRARLIALAVLTIQSPLHRELICAVFGLLSLIGRIAELTPREDEEGRPLPTADLMGYGALGTIFGPLLVGDKLDSYTMELALPTSGMLLFPFGSRGSQFDQRRNKSFRNRAEAPKVDKILVANSIAEMLIANWRDVVRQMKSFDRRSRRDSSLNNRGQSPSISHLNPAVGVDTLQEDEPKKRSKDKSSNYHSNSVPETVTIGGNTRRSNYLNSFSHKLQPKMSLGTLSPTKEESVDALYSDQGLCLQQEKKRSSADADYKSPKCSEGALSLHESDVSQEPNPDRCSRPEGALRLPYYTRGRARKPSLHFADSLVSNMQPNKNHLAPGRPPGSEHGRSNSGPASKAGTDPATQRDIFYPFDGDDGLSHASKQDQRDRISGNAGSCDGSGDSLGPAGLLSREIAARLLVQVSPLELRQKQATQLHNATSNGQLHQVSATTQDAGAGFVLSNSSLETIENRSQHNAKEAGSRSGLKQNDIIRTHSPNPSRKNDHYSSRDQCEQIKQSIQLPEMKTIKSVPGVFKSSNSFLPVIQLGCRRKCCFRGISDDGTGYWKDPLCLQNMFCDCTRAGLGRDSDLLTKSTSAPVRLQAHGGRLHRLLQVHSDPSLSNNNIDRKPRASKSHGRLGANFESSELQISPQSNSPDGFGKRKSVKAMAALIEGRDGQECPKKITMGNDFVKSIRHSELSNLEESRGNAAGGRESGTPRYKKREPHSKSKREQGAGIEGQSSQIGTSRSLPDLTSCPGPSRHELFRPLPNLGIMVPCPEPAPVAQYVKPSRPTCTLAVNAPKTIPDFESIASGAHTSQTGGATVLFAQIRNLQRQLVIKTDEVVQLRRQLEVQKNSEVGTISQQLREVKRKASMWKSRAKSAEKRVKVFEHFTARLRAARDTMLEDDQLDGRQSIPTTSTWLPIAAPGSNPGILDESGSSHSGVYLRPGSPDMSKEGESFLPKTETAADNDLVPEKKRECTHRNTPVNAVQERTLDGLHSYEPSVPSECERSCNSHTLERVTGVRSAAEEILTATEELLRMEDEGII